LFFCWTPSAPGFQPARGTGRSSGERSVSPHFQGQVTKHSSPRPRRSCQSREHDPQVEQVGGPLRHGEAPFFRPAAEGEAESPWLEGTDPPHHRQREEYGLSGAGHQTAHFRRQARHDPPARKRGPVTKLRRRGRRSRSKSSSFTDQDSHRITLAVPRAGPQSQDRAGRLRTGAS